MGWRGREDYSDAVERLVPVEQQAARCTMPCPLAVPCAKGLPGLASCCRWVLDRRFIPLPVAGACRQGKSVLGHLYNGKLGYNKPMCPMSSWCERG